MNSINIGNKVRCYDFFGVKEYYIEGVVTEIKEHTMIVQVEKDTLKPEGRTVIETPLPGNSLMDDSPFFERIVVL